MKVEILDKPPEHIKKKIGQLNVGEAFINNEDYVSNVYVVVEKSTVHGVMKVQNLNSGGYPFTPELDMIVCPVDIKSISVRRHYDNPRTT